MTHSRTTHALAALAATLCLAAPAAANHEVVLKNGTRIPASTRPVIALGIVSFNDVGGRSRSLSAGQVDLTQTREALSRNSQRAAAIVWTAADLEAVRGSVHLQSARAAGAPAERPDSADDSSTRAEIGLARDALKRVKAQRRFLPTDDPETDILEQRKILLQSELLRLETALELEAEPTRMAAVR